MAEHEDERLDDRDLDEKPDRDDLDDGPWAKTSSGDADSITEDDE